MDNDSTNAAAAATTALFGGMMFTVIIIGLCLTVFFVWCFWRVFQKAGYNGALGLLCLVPSIGPLICLLILAFGTWPNQQPEVISAAPIGGVPMTPPPTV
jgi:hypothetical protein